MESYKYTSDGNIEILNIDENPIFTIKTHGRSLDAALLEVISVFANCNNPGALIGISNKLAKYNLPISELSTALGTFLDFLQEKDDLLEARKMAPQVVTPRVIQTAVRNKAQELAKIVKRYNPIESDS